MIETYISDFHTRLYPLEIKELAFHLPHVLILGTNCCGNTRRESFKRRRQINMCCVVMIMLRECQLVLHTKFNLNTMAEIDLYLFKALHLGTLVHQHIPKQQQQHKHAHYMLCLSHFSGDIKQDAATTISHRKHIITFLKQNKLLSVTLITLWENTGSCSGNYICSTALYLVSVLSQALSVIIDCGFSASGHRREVAYGLNYIDKRFLFQIISYV